MWKLASLFRICYKNGHFSLQPICSVISPLKNCTISMISARDLEGTELAEY